MVGHAERLAFGRGDRLAGEQHFLRLAMADLPGMDEELVSVDGEGDHGIGEFGVLATLRVLGGSQREKSRWTPENVKLLRIGSGRVLALPALRTVRAVLSGSSAIAGFRPHGSHRAALPQWAPQKGPEAGRSLQPCLVDRWLREGEGGQELAVGRPVHAALLTAFAERLAPVPDDAVLEHTQ